METPYLKDCSEDHICKDFFLFKNGHLGTNIKLMLYKAQSRSVMTYA